MIHWIIHLFLSELNVIIIIIKIYRKGLTVLLDFLFSSLDLPAHSWARTTLLKCLVKIISISFKKYIFFAKKPWLHFLPSSSQLTSQWPSPGKSTSKVPLSPSRIPLPSASTYTSHHRLLHWLDTWILACPHLIHSPSYSQRDLSKMHSDYMISFLKIFKESSFPLCWSWNFFNLCYSVTVLLAKICFLLFI